MSFRVGDYKLLYLNTFYSTVLPPLNSLSELPESSSTKLPPFKYSADLPFLQDVLETEEEVIPLTSSPLNIDAAIKKVSTYVEECLLNVDFQSASVIQYHVSKFKEFKHHISKYKESFQDEAVIQNQINWFLWNCESVIDDSDLSTQRKFLVKNHLTEMKGFKYLENYLKKKKDYKTLQLLAKKPICNRKRKAEEISEEIPVAKRQKTEVILNDSLNEQNENHRFASRGWKRPRRLDTDTAMQHMFKNSLKAVIEAKHNLYKIQSTLTITQPSEAVDLLRHPPQNILLPKLSSVSMAEDIGPRQYMEDAHFFYEDENRILTGVFDGHGNAGAYISTLVKSFVENNFEKYLKNSENIHQAFEELFFQTQLSLKEEDSILAFKAGSTAVVTFVDKMTGLVYTATLGDSEATLYRKKEQNSEWKSIPLSCVRDWGSKTDETRLINQYIEDPDKQKYKKILKTIKAQRNPKFRRSTIELNENELKELNKKEPLGKFQGVNVSRAFGDFSYAGSEKYPLVICKPKITVNRIKKGDVLILCCDGLKDYVSDHSVAKIIKKLEVGEDLAKKLVDYAIKEAESADNVTVIAIQIPV